MINKTLRRLAVGASAITVAGVVVPIAFASAASAATATSLTVSPTTAYASTSAPGNNHFTVTPNGTTASHVFFDVYSGPDAAADGNGNDCGAAVGGSFTCAVPSGTTAGVDKIHFYIPNGVTNNYQTGDIVADATLVVAGPVAKVTVAPTTSSTSQGVYEKYTVNATDAAGNAVPNANIYVTATEKDTSGKTITTPDISMVGTAPSGPYAGGAATAQPYTATTSGGSASAPPVATFYLASQDQGTVTVTVANKSASPTATATATQTITGGTANDVSSVTVTPNPATGYANVGVTESVTLKNSAGDVIAGVTPSGFVAGTNSTATVAATGATGLNGTTTVSYTPTSAGADTLTVYVNQTDNPVNSGGLDAGEPSGTAAVTVKTAPTVGSGSLTSSCDKGCTVPTSQTSVPVTFTLKDTSGNPIPGAAITYTTAGSTATIASTSPSSPLITDSNGQATVTATVTSPAETQTVKFNATNSQFNTTVTDSATTTYANPTTVTNLTLTPATQSATPGATINETVTATNSTGGAVASATVSFAVTGRNTTANNPGATGTCTTNASGSCTFTYTDMGGSTIGVANTDTVTANVGAVTAAATVYYYTTVNQTAASLSVNINQTAYTSGQSCNTANPNTLTANTGSGSTGKYYQVCVKVKNSSANNIPGKAVTLTSSGVGGFVDSSGNPISGNSETANANSSGNAQFYVQSSTTGTQNLTATADAVYATGTVTYKNANFNPVAPQRLVDTRSGQGGVTKGPLSPNTTYLFDVSNTGFTTPSTPTAYVFNVTAIDPSSGGNLRIGPADGTTPVTSLINYVAGQTSANAVIVPNTGTKNGQFTLYSDGASANVTIDITGYYLGNSFSSVTPTRVADTRNGGTAIGAGSSQTFQVAPATTATTSRAVALNVTAIAPSARGYLEVYPDGATRPTASNINYVPGQTKAAFVVIELPANGKVDVYSAGGSADVAIDLFGTFAATTPASLVTQNPARIYDTRSGAGELQNRQARSIQVTGQGGVPTGAQAVLVSVTAIPAADSGGIGNLRVFPTGQALPTVSTLNYVAGYPVANFAIVPIGQGGKIDLYSDGTNIDVAVDVLGYVPGN